jgi:hypothetical protein
MCTGSIGEQPMLERLGMPVMSQKVAVKKAPMDNFNDFPLFSGIHAYVTV